MGGRLDHVELGKGYVMNAIDADQGGNNSMQSVNADADRCWVFGLLHDESRQQMMIFLLGNTDACK